MSHIPVLLEESIDFLRIIPGGNYFDGTYGEGGHSNAILKNLNKEGRLFATDLDLGAIEIAKKNMDDNVDTIRLEASLSRALNRLKVSKK